MRLLNRRKDKPQVRGKIAYFGLIDWWLSAFTDTERQLIETRYRPLGVAPTEDSPLTRGQIGWSGGTAAKLLWGLSTWFRGPADRHIARCILAKAQELAEAGSSVLDRHFTYQGIIQTYYPDRDASPTALDTAIAACEKQIALAPKAAGAWKHEYPDSTLPRHVGFEQLAIIREKQHNYAEAIRLSKEAMEQGWAGDWNQRIARCEKKLSRSKPT